MEKRCNGVGFCQKRNFNRLSELQEEESNVGTVRAEKELIPGKGGFQRGGDCEGSLIAATICHLLAQPSNLRKNNSYFLGGRGSSRRRKRKTRGWA